jgi:hypothetical protein
VNHLPAVVDPGVLMPPEDDPSLVPEWCDRLVGWSRFFSRGPLSPLLSGACRACVAGGCQFHRIKSILIEAGEKRFGAPDISRLVDAIIIRAREPAQVLDPSEVLWDCVSVEPDYILEGRQRASGSSCAGNGCKPNRRSCRGSTRMGATRTLGPSGRRN